MYRAHSCSFRIEKRSVPLDQPETRGRALICSASGECQLTNVANERLVLVTPISSRTPYVASLGLGDFDPHVELRAERPPFGLHAMCQNVPRRARLYNVCNTGDNSARPRRLRSPLDRQVGRNSKDNTSFARLRGSARMEMRSSFRLPTRRRKGSILCTLRLCCEVLAPYQGGQSSPL